MELKIKYDGRVGGGGGPRIKVFGVVEYAKQDSICALWFAWNLGIHGIEAEYRTKDEAPREVELTVQTGENTIAQMISQIAVMLKKKEG